MIQKTGDFGGWATPQLYHRCFGFNSVQRLSSSAGEGTTHPGGAGSPWYSLRMRTGQAIVYTIDTVDAVARSREIGFSAAAVGKI